MPRIPIVGVMGSGVEPHAQRAGELGRWLAMTGVHLLTGGGGGVMAAVARAFHETPGRRGLVIGILPAEAFGSATPKPGYPNPWVEVPIFTHLPSGDGPTSRNHLNVLSADVVILLPGGEVRDRVGQAWDVAPRRDVGDRRFAVSDRQRGLVRGPGAAGQQDHDVGAEDVEVVARGGSVT